MPITDLQVGDQKGQIPIKQLQRTLMKLPRELKPAAVYGPEQPPQGAAVLAAGAPRPDAEDRPDAEAPAPEGALKPAPRPKVR